MSGLRVGPMALSLAAAVLTLIVIALGRWERQRSAEEEVRAIGRIAAEVGPSLDRRKLTGTRTDSGLACLVYRVGANPSALELCIDGQLRIVEAIDRRAGEPRIWTLRHDPELATKRVSRRSFKIIFANRQS